MDNVMLAERRLLASIFQKPNRVLPDVINALKSSDFTDDTHGKVYSSMLTLWNQGDSIEELSISDSCGVSVAEMTTWQLGEYESSNDAPGYTKIIKRAAIRRTFNEDVHKIAERIDLPIEERLKMMDDLSLSTHERMSSAKRVDTSTVLDEMLTEVKSLRGKIPIKIGIDSLDEAIPCGLQRGHLWILGGYTSTGKTTLGSAQMVAEVAMRGAGAAVFTLEMTRAEIMRKIVGYVMDEGSTNILKGMVKDEVLAKAMARVRRMPIFIDDESNSLPQILAKIRKLQTKHDIRFVVIDYLQLLKGSGSLFDRMSYVANELKRQVKQLGLTILGLSQVNQVSMRENNDALIEYKGGGDIAAAAELCLMLTRKSNEAENRHEMKLHIRKNKHGACYKFDMEYRPNFSGLICPIMKKFVGAERTPYKEEGD